MFISTSIFHKQKHPPQYPNKNANKNSDIRLSIHGRRFFSKQFNNTAIYQYNNLIYETTEST